MRDTKGDCPYFSDCQALQEADCLGECDSGSFFKIPFTGRGRIPSPPSSRENGARVKDFCFSRGSHSERTKKA